MEVDEIEEDLGNVSFGSTGGLQVQRDEESPSSSCHIHPALLFRCDEKANFLIASKRQGDETGGTHEFPRVVQGGWADAVLCAVFGRRRVVALQNEPIRCSSARQAVVVVENPAFEQRGGSSYCTCKDKLRK